MKKYKKRLKELIPEKRYHHSIGVMETAIKLAKIYDEDVKKAELAGLLHDCAKGMTVKDMLKLAHQEGLKLPKSAKENPAVLHAPVGQLVAKKEFNISDPAILSAISYHTTGSPKMNTLDKIIFLADYIEPGRTTPGVDEVRILAEKDLNYAVLECLDRTIRHLTETQRPIEMTTIKTRNHILKEIKREKHE